MAKTNLRLTVESQTDQRMSDKQLRLIERTLNAWFQDAHFTLSLFDEGLRLHEGHLVSNRVTQNFNDWEVKAVTKMLQTAEPVRLLNNDNDKVRVHRLKLKLPKSVTMKSKREGKYQLVNL